MKKLFERTVFENGSIVRHDFDNIGYGFGCMPKQANGYGYAKGVTFFVNSYKKAPIRLSLINCVGKLENAKGVKRVEFSGSRAAPNMHWSLRIGNYFIGGDTPKCIQKYLAYRAAKQFDCNEVGE